VVVVASHDDQYTEGSERVKESGYIGLVVSNTDKVVLSSNVMTRVVGTTILSYSML